MLILSMRREDHNNICRSDLIRFFLKNTTNKTKMISIDSLSEVDIMIEAVVKKVMEEMIISTSCSRSSVKTVVADETGSVIISPSVVSTKSNRVTTKSQELKKKRNPRKLPITRRKNHRTTRKNQKRRSTRLTARNSKPIPRV